ncbi:MAG TPA: cytochrome c maturation protein CcmE [Saprospiraceae bacterium]|nr:cytochrome c maturation protein CcmE [Saprospiraceae bacterium]
MKKIHIIAVLALVVSIVILINASRDVSTYANFAIAEQSGERVKIVGQLAKDQPIIFKPEVDPNRTTFYLKDDSDVIKQVILLHPKPQDFEMAEQIVLTGRMEKGSFVADDILMKCPSKYKDEEILLKKNT